MTISLIGVVSTLCYLLYGARDEYPKLEVLIWSQILLSLGFLLLTYWIKLLGFFLSFSAFTIPFLVLLMNG